MVLLRDIAQAAQVSMSTASRALAGQNFVAQETREKVERVAEMLGYETNLIARSLRRSPTRMIGMLLPNIRSSFSSETAEMLHRQLKDYGYGLILCPYHHDQAIEKNYLESLRKMNLDGLFHKPLGSRNAEALRHGKNPVQVIEILRSSGSTKLDSIGYSDVQSSMQVIQHLVQFGHSRIGLIVGPKWLGSTKARVTGVIQAIELAGIEREKLVIRYADHSPDGGRKAMLQIFAERPEVTAVYASSAQLALGAAIAANESGVPIPSQLSLVGLGDPPWTRLMSPQLITYTVPIREIVMTAALLMMSRIESPDSASAEPVQMTISGRMTVRGSSAPPQS